MAEKEEAKEGERGSGKGKEKKTEKRKINMKMSQLLKYFKKKHPQNNIGENNLLPNYMLFLE